MKEQERIIWPFPSDWDIKKCKKYKTTFKNRLNNFRKRCQDSEQISPFHIFNYIKENPYCYISGEKIDVYNLDSWVFDHYIPVSNGGRGELSNLKISSPKYNRMKSNILFNQFIKMCAKVLYYQIVGKRIRFAK